MTQPDPSIRRRRRGFLAALLSLRVITLGAGIFSLAIFTDSAASTGSFATGTIDITSSPTIAFNVSSMMPGDANTQALTIANAGTSTLRYAMTSAATNVLGTTLQLEVKTLGTNCATFTARRRRPDHLNGALIGGWPWRQGRRRAAAAAARGSASGSLPWATGNALQNTNSAVTFTFAAEQTANNP